MKIFYAIQATGNGHISRAMELLPHLQKYGQVDIFLSGNNSNLLLEAPIQYRSKGLSLYYTCEGKLNYWRILKNIQPLKLKKEIRKLPVDRYDMVINDYDYLTAAACKLKNQPSIHFGHQASFQSERVPRPSTISRSGEWMLKHFATGSTYLGLHFTSYDQFILPPVIKKEILAAHPTNQGHITVYLPSYCEPELIRIFSTFKAFRFEIFSRQTTGIRELGNIRFLPVDRRLFNKSLIHCAQIITGAGFETPAEALHLGKKILAIPIQGQYEQCCNAAALHQLGVMTLSRIGADFKQQFETWQRDFAPVKMDYSHTVPQCMERLFGKGPA